MLSMITGCSARAGLTKARETQGRPEDHLTSIIDGSDVVMSAHQRVATGTCIAYGATPPMPHSFATAGDSED